MQGTSESKYIFQSTMLKDIVDIDYSISNFILMNERLYQYLRSRWKRLVGLS